MKVVPQLHCTHITSLFAHIDLVLGRGDLPAYCLDYVATTLNAPLYYVMGNHAYDLWTGGAKQRGSMVAWTSMGGWWSRAVC